MNKQEHGRAGEETAQAFLVKKGYKPVARNFRTRLGELDLVMRDGATFVFVEVKARRDESFGSPFEAVGGRKQGRVTRAALEYIKQNRLEGAPFRFDVVAVGPKGVEHIENAFDAAGVYTL